MVAAPKPASLNVPRSPVKTTATTAIPCSPKSSGDSSRAKSSVVPICTTSFAPCIHRLTTPPRTDFRFSSLTAGRAKVRDEASVINFTSSLGSPARLLGYRMENPLRHGCISMSFSIDDATFEASAPKLSVPSPRPGSPFGPFLTWPSLKM